MPENMVVNFFQHQVPGFNGGPIRIKGGKAPGNQVRLVGQNSPANMVLPAPFSPAMMRVLGFSIRLISTPLCCQVILVLIVSCPIISK